MFNVLARREAWSFSQPVAHSGLEPSQRLPGVALRRGPFEVMNPSVREFSLTIETEHTKRKRQRKLCSGAALVKQSVPVPHPDSMHNEGKAEVRRIGGSANAVCRPYRSRFNDRVCAPAIEFLRGETYGPGSSSFTTSLLASRLGNAHRRRYRGKISGGGCSRKTRQPREFRRGAGYPRPRTV